MKTNETNTMEQFLNGFATAAGIDRANANEQWAGFSNQLTDSDRSEIEAGGYNAGVEHGREFGKLYPEKYAIRQDPSNPGNWGIVWETSGTEGGFTSEAAARQSAIRQNGVEAEAYESATWEW